MSVITRTLSEMGTAMEQSRRKRRWMTSDSSHDDPMTPAEACRQCIEEAAKSGPRLSQWGPLPPDKTVHGRITAAGHRARSTALKMNAQQSTHKKGF